MTNRATSLLPCLAATMLAGAAVATFQVQSASAADECLAKPKAGAPGKHWFYRIDRATKRQCWYVRDGDQAQVESSATRKTAARNEPAKLSSAAANAHAEFETQPAAAGHDDVKPAPASASPAPSYEESSSPRGAAAAAAMTPQAAAEGNATASGDQSTITTRWPDPNATLQTPAAPLTAAPSYKLAAASETQAAPEASVAAATPPAAGVAAAGVGDTTSSFSAPLSADDASRTRLMAFLGAVALTGFATSVLFARARSRRRIQIEPVRRGSRWPSEPQLDRMQLAAIDDYPALPRARDLERGRPNRLSVVPQDDVSYEEQYQVEDLLARYSGQHRRRS